MLYKSLIESYMQVWTVGQAHQLKDLAAEDLMVNYSHFPEPYTSRASFQAMLEQTHSMFPDLKLYVDELIEAKEKHTVKWHYEGHFKEGELFGVQADNQAVFVQGISVLQIEDGLVIKEEGMVDNLSLAMQIGAM